MVEINSPVIVYASDNRFAEVLGISLMSLFECSKEFPEIIVYILDSDISINNKRKIELVCKKYQRSNPIFVQAKNINKELGINVSVDRGSLSQYARLFISSILPDDIERVLYLDCDILFRKSVDELWNIDLQGKTIGALMDAFSKYYRMNIGLLPEDLMFNSGVMLIDLKRWKYNEIEKKILTFIRKKNGRIQQGDQGALNAVLSKDTLCIEPRFNSVTIFYDFTYEEMMTYRQPPEFYSKSVIREAVLYPVIVHFTTSIFSRRPWVIGCHHPYVHEWLEYKEESPWKNDPLWQNHYSIFKRGIMGILNRIPRKGAIFIASLMQVYVRPWYYKISEYFRGVSF